MNVPTVRVVDPIVQLPELTVAPASPAQDPNLSSSTPAPAQNSTSASAPVKPAYPPPAEIPTQKGPKGLRFDFNNGARVVLPESDQPWRVRLSDLDTGNILFETEIKAGSVNSSKRYYVRFRVEVWQKEEIVLSHDYSAA